MKVTYYDVGIPPDWTFQNFHERVYIAFFNQFTMWTTRNVDEVIHISEFGKKCYWRERRIFDNGTWHDYKKCYSTPKSAETYNLWKIYWVARWLIRLFEMPAKAYKKMAELIDGVFGGVEK